MEFKNALSKTFIMKHLKKLRLCHGLEFTRSTKRANLKQKGYILNLLIRFGISELKPVANSSSLCFYIISYIYLIPLRYLSLGTFIRSSL